MVTLNKCLSLHRKEPLKLRCATYRSLIAAQSLILGPHVSIASRKNSNVNFKCPLSTKARQEDCTLIKSEQAPCFLLRYVQSTLWQFVFPLTSPQAASRCDPWYLHNTLKMFMPTRAEIHLAASVIKVSSSSPWTASLTVECVCTFLTFH